MGEKFTFEEVNQAKTGQTFSFEEASQPEATLKQKVQASIPGRVFQGARDPVDASAQLLYHVLPDSVVKAGNRFNNWLADKTGLVARMPAGGIDEMTAKNEQEYQLARLATNGGKAPGFDLSRLAGNVVATAPIAAAVPGGTTLVGKTALGALTGAGMGALQPVTKGDFWSEKAKQTALGGATGAAVPLVVGGLARMVKPNVNQNVKTLMDEGVTPTLGQMMGGRWNALEEKLQSIPIMGDAIASARTRALKEFNNAAINRAVAPIGKRVEGTGHAAVKEAGDLLSQGYDDALSQVKYVKFDQQFNQDITQLNQMAQNLVPELRSKFNNTMQNIVMGRMSKNGTMMGDVYKSVDSELGNLASRYSKSSVSSEQELGDALLQLKNLLNQQMRRSNPDVAGRLADVDAGWANLVRLEGAAKSGKNAEGVFTPGQLNMAIQSADDSVRKRAVARGTALMQDLGSAGQSVLGNKVPNSFTPDRLLIAGGALGSYFMNPAIPTGLAAGAVPYTAPVQKALAYALTQRPQAAITLADLMRKSAPLVQSAAVPSVYQLSSK